MSTQAASAALGAAASAAGSLAGAVGQAAATAAGSAASQLGAAGFGWVDAALGFVLLASIVLGLVRGFVFELLSLAGWVAAWFGAQWFAPGLAAVLPVGEPGSALRHGAAFALAFVGCLLVWAIGARLVRLIIRATPLSLPDRVLGSAFGFVRGLVIGLAVATLVAFTPLSRSDAWQQSRAAAWLGAALVGLAPLLPPQWSRHLPRAGVDAPLRAHPV